MCASGEANSTVCALPIIFVVFAVRGRMSWSKQFIPSFVRASETSHAENSCKMSIY